GVGVDVPTGTTCLIETSGQNGAVKAEVVGFRDGHTLLMPYGDVRGIRPGARITPRGGQASVGVGQSLLGRVIDGLGQPIDGLGPIAVERLYPLYAKPINPLDRPRISQPVDVGVRAINGLLTIGKGQRVGIFAGSGVGKSTLLGMIARNTSADVSVVGLIGERGREVKEFLERDLGQEGLKRSVVVAATSDQPPLIRMRGAYLATAVAEYFRDQGADVLMMFDSMTRFSMAGREVGLAVGEPPTTKGYTPSVFAHLPKILERAGTSNSGGSVSGIYTVLVEGDDFNDPIADGMRAILDGHIVLTRELAEQDHYPAIDVLKSVSRLMIDVASEKHLGLARAFCQLMATYRRNEDVINIGAYVQGSNPSIDRALANINDCNDYLRQPISEKVSLEQSVSQLAALLDKAGRGSK
ncbi:MAG: FliI/YscN family ATPase, partial [Deltaproteobacteria bacterium]|nr:FliI/YscN family ATPase [Deltaproteobacteria bacterium]